MHLASKSAFTFGVRSSACRGAAKARSNKERCVRFMDGPVQRDSKVRAFQTSGKQRIGTIFGKRFGRAAGWVAWASCRGRPRPCACLSRSVSSGSSFALQGGVGRERVSGRTGEGLRGSGTMHGRRRPWQDAHATGRGLRGIKPRSSIEGFRLRLHPSCLRCLS